MSGRDPSDIPAVHGGGPVVFFDSVNAIAVAGDIVQLTVQAFAPIHQSGDMSSARVIAGHLRMPVAAILPLIGDLDRALLLAARPASDERN